MDKHAFAFFARIAAALLGLFLLVRTWGIGGGAGSPAGNFNFFLTASLLMCVGLVLLADKAIDEPGLSGLAQGCGYVGLAGVAIALLV